ncbi:reticulon-4 receptor-like 1b [Polypterus senegalus]|uniref:reticulon-4 receptor-like 1b n=1 Tax=Polypterus senegalus TaxID=55291 RepID=UPI00196664FB|nr:reticulon-4 receptor-like 1b [Polypterus senegalus]
MFKRGYGLEFFLMLCGLELQLSWSCPRHCVCYTSPTTVSCQAHNFLTVPEGIPPHSERIFLQNNRIGMLLRGHFSPHTVTLWIYSNNITFIDPDTFQGFTQLEELDLGDNKYLRALAAETFHGLSKLHALHLYRCGLSSLPDGIFQGLHSLQYLYLQDNRIESLQDNLFVDLVNLSHLFLHGNKLWSLHQNTFRGLSNLDRLLLHQNQLQWVHRWAFHDLKKLTTLYLFNNSLTQLSGECLAQLPSLEYLRLNGNPWECSCKSHSLWDWLQRFRGSSSSVLCESPSEVRGKDLKQLSKDEFPNCSGSESLHQIKTSTWTTADKSSFKEDQHSHHHNNHHHHHHGQQQPPGVIPPPADKMSPPSSNNIPPSTSGTGHVGSQRPHGSRNCTRQRSRGPKKGPNEVHPMEEMADKEYSPMEFPGEDKFDHTAGPPRRKPKCTRRPPVRPPSGVQQATNAGSVPHSSFSLVSRIVALWVVLAVIMR